MTQDGSSLTTRQHQVLAFVVESYRAAGVPPTVRAVMLRFKITTPRGAQIHLQALVRKGYLTHEPGRHPAYWPKLQTQVTSVPILGSAPAGHPQDVPEDHTGQLLLPWGFSDEAFAVQVKGHSMRDADVLDGDFVVIDPSRSANDGDVVLALLRGESTIKGLRKTRASFELRPANPDFTPQSPSEDRDTVIGPVVALVRRTR